jgi:CRP-like cAMP-binding protein
MMKLLLGKVPMLKDFPMNDLAVLAGIAQLAEFDDGQVVLEQGERPRAAYLLINGNIEVKRRLPGGGSARICTLPEGSMFGTVALVDGLPRAASCTARGWTRVAEFQADDFRRLMNSTSPLGIRFQLAVVRQIIRDMRTTTKRLAELASVTTVDAEDLASTLSGLA